MFVVQEQTLHELQLRVKQQSVEMEKGNALCQKVSQEKAQLEIHSASISTELQEANRRCVCVCVCVCVCEKRGMRSVIGQQHILLFLLTQFF